MELGEWDDLVVKLDKYRKKNIYWDRVMYVIVLSWVLCFCVEYSTITKQKVLMDSFAIAHNGNLTNTYFIETCLLQGVELLFKPHYGYRGYY